jgi:hypothetical protein
MAPLPASAETTVVRSGSNLGHTNDVGIQHDQDLVIYHRVLGPK